MAVGDVWRASIVGDWSANPVAVYTLHFRAIDAGALVSELAGDIKSDLIDNLKVHQPTTFNTRQINFNTVNVTPPLSSIYTTGFPVAGTNANQPIPYTAAVVVSIRSAYAGRRYRGRIYLPIGTEELVNGSTISGGLLTDPATYVGALLNHYGPSGTSTNWRWVVWSRKYSTYVQVESVIVRSVLGTVRRRRPGVGV